VANGDLIYSGSFNTITTSGTSVSPWNGTTYVYPTYTTPAAPAAPIKEIPMVAGAAPVKTLHTRYAQVKGGYVGQVVYGDPERTTSEGVIAWESLPFPFGPAGEDDDDAEYAGGAKDKALKAAQAALDKAFLSMFAGIPATGPRPRAAKRAR
jgi:hypothetical protein